MSRDYYCVRVDAKPCSSDITDLAASYLADCGFETFDPDAEGLLAYIPADIHDNIIEVTRDALRDFPIDCSFDIHADRIEGQDWNEEWEKNYFKPIVIEGECVIHSSFHKDVPQAKYDIVIDPKMAFGTGHHHTTSRMAAWILEEDLVGKSLVDVGTGTGILAMLAAMRGANPVFGIEIDPGAYENAVENVALNGCDAKMILGDASALSDIPRCDYLLANINRNIILNDIEAYAHAVKPDGCMIFSGFYDHDLPMIEEATAKYGFIPAGVKVSDHWTAAKFIRKTQG